MAAGEVNDGASPGATQVLPLIAVAPAVAFALRWANGHLLVQDPLATVIVAGGAGLLGIPVLFFALDHGRSRLWTIVVAGALMGVFAMALPLVAGVAGLAMRHSWSFAMRAFERGAPLPWFGQFIWPRYFGLVAWAAFLGATIAAAHWMIFVERRGARGVAFAIATVAAAMGLATLFP